PGAIDLGRLEEIARQGTKEVAQQVDSERQAVGRVGDPHAKKIPAQPERFEERKDGDQGHLQRNRKQADEQQEEPVAQREPHPGKGVGGKGGDGDRHDGRRDGDREAVDEAGEEVVGLQHVAVVLQRELERRRQGGPPTGARDQESGTKRADQKTEGRHDPDDREQDERQIQRQRAKREPTRLLRRLDHDRRLSARGSGDRGNAHRMASWNWNRRRLKMRTGTTANNNSIAIAAEVPKFWLLNISPYIRRAITSVS